MIVSSAGDHNPVPPIIHVIDEALGRLLYFPIGYQPGLLHSSEIGPGESAMGHSRRFGRSGPMSATTLKATVPATRRNGRDGPRATFRAAEKAASFFAAGSPLMT